MDEERKEEVLDFVRSIRDEVRDIARLVRQGVVSSEEYMDIKARSDEGDTTITEDKKAQMYNDTMSHIRGIELYAKVVLDVLKKERIEKGEKGEKRGKVL